jgi:hypothetical protein
LKNKEKNQIYKIQKNTSKLNKYRFKINKTILKMLNKKIIKFFNKRTLIWKNMIWNNNKIPFNIKIIKHLKENKILKVFKLTIFLNLTLQSIKTILYKYLIK